MVSWHVLEHIFPGDKKLTFLCGNQFYFQIYIFITLILKSSPCAWSAFTLNCELMTLDCFFSLQSFFLLCLWTFNGFLLQHNSGHGSTRFQYTQTEGQTFLSNIQGIFWADPDFLPHIISSYSGWEEGEEKKEKEKKEGEGARIHKLSKSLYWH